MTEVKMQLEIAERETTILRKKVEALTADNIKYAKELKEVTLKNSTIQNLICSEKKHVDS